jgi:hypothetical protein
MTRRRGLLAAVLIVFAGCGSHHVARTQTTPTASASVSACGDADERTHAIRFRATDGVTLAGAVAGSGPVGAVLIHECPLDHCGWWPYARYLSRHGVRVLMFDLRCFGRSACLGGRGRPVTDVAAAMAELSAGARDGWRWSARRWAARSRSSPQRGCIRPRSSISRARATRPGSRLGSPPTRPPLRPG